MEHSINDWGFSFAVVITGLVVVFAVLLILVLMCNIMGNIFKAIDNKKKNANSGASATNDISVGNNVVKMQSGAAVINSGISCEVIAAITAAVDMMMEQNGVKTAFVLKSVKRTRTSRPAWNEASIQENTRPF